MQETDRLCPICGDRNRHSPGTSALFLGLGLDLVVLLFGLLGISVLSSKGGLILILLSLGAGVFLVRALRIRMKKEGELKAEGNPLVKTQTLSKRIALELEKITSIDSLLDNIYRPQIRSKVVDGRAKIERLVDSLIRWKVNLDFLRFYNDYAVIDRANKAGVLQPDRLSQLLEREDDKLVDWKADLERQLDRPVTWECYEEKIALVKALKERISLGMVSNLLSSTTLLNTDSSAWDVQPSELDIDEEIGRITYEIDRLNAELELDKLRPGPQD